MSKAGWLGREREIAAALEHAREKRMLLTAQTQRGIRLLERRVSTGQLVEPFTHLYEEPAYWHDLKPPDKALRVIRGAALLHPGWVFCHVSAALAHDLQVSCPMPGIVHVATTRKAHLPCAPGVVRHIVDDALMEDVTVSNGVRVVSLGVCVRQCLCSLDLKFGLAVADSYLQKQEMTSVDLERALQADPACRRGRRQALRTASYADPLAENGGESVARGAMIELGYRIPELQVPIANPVKGKGGRDSLYRVDFLWREGVSAPIIGELDGMDKYRDVEMLGGGDTLGAITKERLRESRLTLTGASVLRFRFGDVLNPKGFSDLLDAAGVPRA